MKRFLLPSLFAFLLAGSAYAQPSASTWNENLEKQVVQSLDSPVERIQEKTIGLIIYYESHDRFYDDDRFDFDEAAQQLAAIVRSSSGEKRLLAETALYFSNREVWEELRSGPLALQEPTDK